MFRDHHIQTGEWEPQAVFYSSGTTGFTPGKHLIRDKQMYHHLAEKTFTKYFGSPSSYTWIALLPSYLERSESSLVDMVAYFMNISRQELSGFYSRIDDKIISVLQKLSVTKQKTILFGVSFALLDLFEKYNVPAWGDLLVIETGGMKGRRDEITREELHQRIRKPYTDLKIASEYGMTELMSQAYMVEGRFRPADTMRVLTRDISDPQTMVSSKRGAVNVIDLANLDSCAFISTDDIGYVYEDGSFDISGRLDQSDIRGCNLLYA